MDMTSVYAPIFKSVPQEDGSLFVYGKATDSSLDLDHQVCDSKWLREEMPRWFAVGNVRESHDSQRAVGKATELEAKEDGGHYVKARIVDPLAKAKIEAGILSGFSIGVKNPRIVKDAKAPGGRITAGRIVELSIVDYPANEGCRLDLVKAMKPGTDVTSPDVDEDRMLVKVEELHETATEPPAVMPTPRDLAARLSKAANDLAVRLGDATPDGDSPEPAVDPDVPAVEVPAPTPVTEAVEVTPEQTEEEPVATPEVEPVLVGAKASSLDVDALAKAIVTGVTSWMAAEAARETPRVELAVTPDVTKTDAPASAEPTAPEPGDETRLAELVKSAVTAALAAPMERITALEADLAKVSALPEPGGPVITRTAGQAAVARETDQREMAIAELLKKAAAASDPVLRRGYTERAEALKVA